MPGPCSAPNGDSRLTTMNRSKGQIVKSGKTALKKGHIEHASKSAAEKRFKLTRKQRQQQEED